MLHILARKSRRVNVVIHICMYVNCMTSSLPPFNSKRSINLLWERSNSMTIMSLWHSIIWLAPKQWIPHIFLPSRFPTTELHKIVFCMLISRHAELAAVRVDRLRRRQQSSGCFKSREDCRYNLTVFQTDGQSVASRFTVPETNVTFNIFSNLLFMTLKVKRTDFHRHIFTLFSERNWTFSDLWCARSVVSWSLQFFNV
jgi:hypothetical protein